MKKQKEESSWSYQYQHGEDYDGTFDFEAADLEPNYTSNDGIFDSASETPDRNLMETTSEQFDIETPDSDDEMGEPEFAPREPGEFLNTSRHCKICLRHGHWAVGCPYKRSVPRDADVNDAFCFIVCSCGRNFSKDGPCPPSCTRIKRVMERSAVYHPYAPFKLPPPGDPSLPKLFKPGTMPKMFFSV